MIFRLVLTWTLFALIAFCNAYDAYQAAPGPAYNEESIILNNLIPYEKFVEGDLYEPLLYGTYSVSENVSPFIPVNTYDGYVANSGSAYQTPANGYQAKPMPANFNVYTAKNPTPVQYNPALPQAYAPPQAYQAKPDLTYGLNYEQNQKTVFIPSISYPSTAAYPAPAPIPIPAPTPVSYGPPAVPSLPIAYPPVSYQPNLPISYPAPAPYPAYPPMIPPSIYPKPGITFPIVHSNDKPAPSTAKNETVTKPTDGKKEDTDKLANSAPIMNEIPSVKPPTEVKPAPAPVNPPEVKPTPAPIVPPVEQKPPVVLPPLMQPMPFKGKPTYPSKSNYTKFTGYRYIAKTDRRRSQPVYDTRSMSPMYNQNHVRSFNPNYYTRQAHPQTGPNPYSPSASNYQNSTKTNDHHRRSNMPLDRRSAAYSNANQYKVAPTPKHPTYARSANYNYNYNAPTPQNYYAAASPSYSASYPQTSIYNENNVAESILRGYSVSPDENNNKAIVRIFEEPSNGVHFDFRICDLKKDHLYSIYVHNFGSIASGCFSTGDQYGGKDTYFNPILGLRTNPSGFLGSFKYNGENLNIQHFTKKLRLIDIVGRSIVIHEISTNQKVLPEALENNMLNSFSMLLNPLSSPLISSRRVACGIIGRANPYSFLRPPNQNCEIEVPVVEETPLPEPLPTRRDVSESVKSEVKESPKMVNTK